MVRGDKINFHSSFFLTLQISEKIIRLSLVSEVLKCVLPVKCADVHVVIYLMGRSDQECDLCLL